MSDSPQQENKDEALLQDSAIQNAEESSASSKLPKNSPVEKDPSESKPAEEEKSTEKQNGAQQRANSAEGPQQFFSGPPPIGKGVVAPPPIGSVKGPTTNILKDRARLLNKDTKEEEEYAEEENAEESDSDDDPGVDSEFSSDIDDSEDEEIQAQELPVSSKKQQQLNKKAETQQQQSTKRQNDEPQTAGKKQKQPQEQPKNEKQQQDPKKNSPAATKNPKETGDKKKVENLGDGLKIQILNKGSEFPIKKGSKVGIFYTGKLASGKVFDSNVGKSPLTFTVGKNQVIPGMEKGVLSMNFGGKSIITIPPELGYGKKSLPGIPPNSTLIFEIETLSSSKK